MGLLDILTGHPADPNNPGNQYSDVPIGYRLGLLGNILSATAQGQTPSPAGFIGMAKLKADASAQRKQAHQMELASKYLDKRPDLKPLVESGAIDIGDIIKMDREDSKTQSEHDWWKAQEDYKREHDPNVAWLQQFSGGGSPPVTTQPGTADASAPAPVPTSGETPAPTNATGVPPAPGGVAVPPMPAAPGQANPVTARLRTILQDPTLNDNEAAYIAQTVHNPDDLRAAYDAVLKNRTEMAKNKTEQQKADDAKAEVAKKEADANTTAKAGQMQAVSSIDSMLAGLDKTGLPTAGIGSMFSMLPGTDAYEFNKNLLALKSYVAFDKLAQLRAESKTGASGLGQVSNYEQQMLGNSQGAIDQGMQEDTLRGGLKTLRTKIVAFNTPSREDPSKSVMTVDCEKLAADPSPEKVRVFEQKYGVGSSSVITGDTTPAADRPGGEDPAALTPDEQAILDKHLNPQGSN